MGIEGGGWVVVVERGGPKPWAEATKGLKVDKGGPSAQSSLLLLYLFLKGVIEGCLGGTVHSAADS